MRFLDTGVVVAAFASWHEHHAEARNELPGSRLAGHTLVEAFSVLTRLPPPHRVRAEVAAEFLRLAFPEPVPLEAEALQHLVLHRLPGLDITGGAVYDALIAETVKLAGGTLITLDRRAMRTYERIGCEVRLLGGTHS